MTSLKEILIDQIHSSVHLLDASAKAVPTDKQNWSPGGKARSTLALVAECAAFPEMIIAIVENKAFPDGHGLQQLSDGDTVELLLEKLHRNSEKLCSYINSFPEDQMDLEIKLPWETATVSKIFG